MSDRAGREKGTSRNKGHAIGHKGWFYYGTLVLGVLSGCGVLAIHTGLEEVVKHYYEKWHDKLNVAVECVSERQLYAVNAYGILNNVPLLGDFRAATLQTEDVFCRPEWHDLDHVSFRSHCITEVAKAVDKAEHSPNAKTPDDAARLGKLRDQLNHPEGFSVEVTAHVTNYGEEGAGRIDEEASVKRKLGDTLLSLSAGLDEQDRADKRQDPELEVYGTKTGKSLATLRFRKSYIESGNWSAVEAELQGAQLVLTISNSEKKHEKTAEVHHFPPP